MRHSSRSVQRPLPPRRRSRLRLEILEDRTLLSAAVVDGPARVGPFAIDPASYDPSGILVRFRDAAAEGVLSGTTVGPELALVPGLRHVRLEAGVDVETALAAYRALPHVAYAEPDSNTAILDLAVDLAFGADRNGDSLADLYVIGRGEIDNVVVYDGQTGAFVQEFLPTGSGLNGAAWLVFGPDGDLFVGTITETGLRDAVLRVDQTTQAVTTFISNIPAENGGLNNAKGMAFGPDGNCYVASANTDQVLRYDGDTGAFIDAFVPAGSGGLDHPNNLLFGPDRNNDAVSDLYVTSGFTDEVLVYSGANGTSLGAFVAAGSGGLDGPFDMAFGPDGHLYVTSGTPVNDPTLRFDGASGAFIDVVVPDGMTKSLCENSVFRKPAG